MVEEFWEWQDVFSFDTLMKCQQFWNQTQFLEMLVSVVLKATKNSSTVHEALKRTTQSLFWTRASFLATSLGLHLAHPSKLEGHLDQWGSHLLEGIQLLENCVTELTNYKTPMMGLIQQMKYLQSQLHLHQHWVKSITKRAMELCVRRDSAVRPLEFSDLSGTSDLSHLIAQRM